VRWSLSAHARRLLTLALAGLVIAIVTRRPEFAGLAAPAVLLLATWRIDRPRQVGVRARMASTVVVEGTQTSVGVEIRGLADFWATLLIEPVDTVSAGAAVMLPAGEPDRFARLRLVPMRWGRRSLGLLVITFTDRYRLSEGEILVQLPLVNCRPRPAQLTGSVVLNRLPSRLGEHAARVTGEGGEFAGVREFVPGDRQRRINWPATTRRGSLQLNTFAAEQAQNVVVIVDVSSDVGEPGSSSIDLAYRAAAGAIRAYLAARDRVGLVLFGGRVFWVGVGAGRRHFRRMIDLMVASPGGWDRAPGLARLPRAALPPGALILVFSPLLDPLFIETLRDLRERGFSVIVVDVLNAEPSPRRSKLSQLTGQLWRLEQEAVRFSLTQIGVPVVHWDGVSSLDEPLAPYTRRVVVARR
jgi:uncharacterized protein (DUF58 family)